MVHFAIGEQFWIMAQMAVDLFMLILLAKLFVLVQREKRRIVYSDELTRPAEKLLEQMEEMSLSLEKKFEKRRELAETVVTELETLLSDARQATDRLAVLLDGWRKTEAAGKRGPGDMERLKRSSRVLSEKGFSKAEIAKRLHIPMGELELMLKL